MPSKLKITPLGGINEIGKNLTVYESENDIILVDCGLAFPDEDMYGVDIVIPDFQYLRENKGKIRALFITHGHEDHIGAVTYLMRECQCPIYCTALTAGLLSLKLDEARLTSIKPRTCKPGDVIRAGCFSVEFIHVNHSMPGTVAFAIKTPMGTILQTGDFKIDSTPVDGDVIDIPRIGQIAKEGILCLLSDSTNVERPGYAMSERQVGVSLMNHFAGCDKRIIVTTFASNVHRIQQIIDAAVANGRRVAITGRSMENILRVAIQLDYIDIPPHTIIEMNQVKSFPQEKVCIITTGSQGEPMSALSRMAFGTHKEIDLGAQDRIIISASPIPGNEKTVSRLVNELFRRGCEVVYEKLANVHVSGHACQEELKLMLAVANPKFFVPVHGEYKMLKTHIGLARAMGIDAKNTLIPELGRPIEFTERGMKLLPPVPSGRILVDGTQIGSETGTILRDRKNLALDGIIVIVLTIDPSSSTVVAGPEIVSRGFVFSRESDADAAKIRQIATQTIDECIDQKFTDRASIKQNLRNNIGNYLFRRTRRKPMILPVIMEV